MTSIFFFVIVTFTSITLFDSFSLPFLRISIHRTTCLSFCFIVLYRFIEALVCQTALKSLIRSTLSTKWLLINRSNAAQKVTLSLHTARYRQGTMYDYYQITNSSTLTRTLRYLRDEENKQWKKNYHGLNNFVDLQLHTSTHIAYNSS